MPAKQKQILVTGFPRSGFGSLGRILKLNSIHVGHETIEEHGTVSWCHTGYGKLSWLDEPVKDVRDNSDIIVHLVRFPLNVIASAGTLTVEVINFMRQNLGKPELTTVTLADVVELYLDWNQRIEDSDPHCCIKIEDLNDSAAVRGLIDRLRAPMAAAFYQDKIEKDFNARSHQQLNWRILRNELPTELFDRLVAKTESYGYPIPEPTTVAVCIMGKNEKHYLESLVKSIKEVSQPKSKFYDRAVYLDTGSTDGSVEFMEKAGFEVHRTEWQDNFSLHRNELIDIVKTGWIVMVDCDERLVGHFGLLKGLLSDVPYDVNALRVRMEDFKNGKASMVWNVEKIFRADTCRYESRVHNQLKFEGTAPQWMDGKIEHHGYDISKEAMDKKMARTQKLLAMRLNENPDDHDVYFYMAQNESYFNNYETALGYVEKYIEAYANNSKINKSIYLIYCQLLYNLDRFQQLEGVYEWLLVNSTHDLDVYYHMTVYGISKRKSRWIKIGTENYIETSLRFQQSPELMNSFFFHYLGDEHSIFILSANTTELFRLAVERHKYLHKLKSIVPEGHTFAANVDKQLKRYGVTIGSNVQTAKLNKWKDKPYRGKKKSKRVRRAKRH